MDNFFFSSLFVSSPLNLSSSLWYLAYSLDQAQIRSPRPKLTTEVLSQISIPIFFLVKTPNKIPWFFSLSMQVSIGMRLLGL